MLPSCPEFAALRADVPVDCYRHGRLCRALGASLPVPLQRGCISSPAPPATSPDRRLGQYRGDVTVGTWNAQALFAACDHRRGQKMLYVQQLMRKLDVLLVTEAHGTAGDYALGHHFPGCTGWWSSGPTTGHAGVGVIVRNAFLEQFDASPVCSDVWKGRAAKLSLRGKAGALDVVVANFHTGTLITEMDLYDVRPQEGSAVRISPACGHASGRDSRILYRLAGTP